MNKNYKVKNFRVFDEKGADFEIAPITIITGCNSSGKSTVLKSLMLFGQMCQELYSDYVKGNNVFLNQYELKFNTGNHKLGNYETVLSKHSKSSDITFGYTKYSNFLLSDIEVEFLFGKNEDDFLGNGLIKKVTIKLNHKDLIVLEVVDNLLKYQIDAVKIKKHFFNYLKYYNLYKDIKNDLNRFGSIDDLLFFNSYEHFMSIENAKEVNSIIISEKDMNKRDDVEKLWQAIDKINDKYNSLFYLPVLDWFGEADKNSIAAVIEKKMEELNIESSKYTLLRQALQEIIDDFLKSDKLTFESYLLAFEDDYLNSLLEKPIESNDKLFHQKVVFELLQIDSFIKNIQSNFIVNDPRFGVAVISDLVSRLAYHKTRHVKYYYTLLALSVYDENFMKNRIDAKEPDPIDWNYIEFYLPIEIQAANLFLSAILQECLVKTPSFLTKITFIDAVKANVHRLYTFQNQGTNFNNLMQEYIRARNLDIAKTKKIQSDRDKFKFRSSEHNTHKTGEFINNWLKRFGIADELIFELTSDNVGLHIFLVKGNEKILLADEGFGVTQIVYVLLQIEIIIATSAYKFSHPFIKGVEQKFRESTIAIEEPEINLHPKFQSLLADLFINAYKTFNIHFVVETHSEYIIRKLQTFVAKKEIKPDDVALHYLYPHDKQQRPKGKPQVMKIRIKDDGRLNESFGTGFFDEADNLAMDLLKIKSLN